MSRNKGLLRYGLLFILFLAVTGCGVPEKISISGTVATADGHPLHEAAVAYQSLADESQAGIVITDEQGRFTIANATEPVKLYVTADGWRFPEAVPIIRETRSDLQITAVIEPRLVHELAYYDLMLGAVTIDMARWIGWLWDDTAAVQSAAEENQRRLRAVIQQLETLPVPDPALNKAGQALIDTAAALHGLYEGIQDKTMHEIQAEADASETLYAQYRGIITRYAANWETDWKPQPDFSTSSQGLYYRRAQRRIETGEFAAAVEILEMLLDIVPPSSTERHHVLLRAVDALGALRYEEEAPEHSETMLAYLTEILEAPYSPLFYEAFVRWRTTAQTYLYGMDNAGPIPNWDFNRVRRDLLEKLWQSDAAGAVSQIQQLLLLDNITRGGPGGNSNVLWETELFMP